MPRVIFYLNLRARETFLLNFLEQKVLGRGMTALIVTAAGESARLDEWLWTARPGNFIPHALAGEFNAEDGTPILIAENADKPQTQADVLVLWGGETPAEFGGFGHVIIAPPRGDNGWQSQKDHFADRGCEINIHQMGA